MARPSVVCTRRAGSGWYSVDRNDVLIGLGGVIVAIGVGLFSLPAGIIVAGIEMIALGVVGALIHSRQPE